MKMYINTILTVSLVGGIINTLAPSKSGLKKYVNYITSIVCVLCLISPLTTLLSNTSSLKESINNFVDKIFVVENIDSANSLIVNSSKEKIEEGIKEAIIQKYGFNENEVIVDLILDTNKIDAIKIECVNVTLTGKASWSDTKTVKDYLNNLIGTEIEVKRR